MSALQMPVYWIFLETFQFLSVPLSPFSSDATHTQRCQFKRQRVIFLLCVKTNKQNTTPKQTIKPNQTKNPQIPPSFQTLMKTTSSVIPYL